eukprot:symbB.v1.2.028059.t1/scaffold2934.1/size84817/1
MPSRQKAIKVLKSKNLLVSQSAPRLPVAPAITIREDVVETAPMPTAEELPKALPSKLPKLTPKRGPRGSTIGPLPPNWRPSSRGQTVSRAAAAAFWGLTLEDSGSDIGDEEEFQGSHHVHRRASNKPPTEFPLAALHAATSVPFADLKEACSIFERFGHSESEDITQVRLDMEVFSTLLCHVTGAESVSDLSQEFVKSAFHTADRNHTGDIDIWEFVTWYSAFSFSEAVCVNKFARETRDVARKHGMSILNIERYKKSFDRYDLNSNGVIEFSEFKNIITDLLKIPSGLDLPQERVMSMWRNADKDGSGSIDFEEFVAFYVKVFGDTFETDFDPVKSPNWHRRVRARRSRARHRVHRWVLQPRTSTLGLVRAAVDLLEKHHSQPTYTTIRRMPQWWDKPRYWKGSWSAGSGGKGKGQSPKPKGGGKKKDEKEQDIAFPAYDALPSSSASTASSGSQDTDLRQIVKALVQSSAVSLPEEAKKFLEQEEASDFRQELKKTQTQLNRRRKAHGKLLRLRETLSEKHNQYNLFREKMKEQLLSQQQKYEEDVKSLEKAILDAEQALLEIKSDEEKEDPNGPAPMETPELEDILQIDADKKKVELNLAKELEQSKQETAATKKMFNLQPYQRSSGPSEVTGCGTNGPDDLVGSTSAADDDDGATMTVTFEKWLLYRPNPFGRDQLPFCAIRIDPNDLATSFVNGVNSCWPGINANGLQHIAVHNSVMRSSSRKGADKVYVGDDRIDGRNDVIGARRVVTEVQIHYGASLFTVDSQARYVTRRSDFDTIFRGEPWIDKCRREPTHTCFGFVNGANRPWRSITVYEDGDFVEVQILSSEEPSASTDLRHYQEDDEDLFARADEPPTNRASSSQTVSLDPIETIIFRPLDEVPGLAPYWSFSAHPDDGQEQFAIALRHCWPDLDDSTRWSLLIPHDSWRTSMALSFWRAAYIIDHVADRKLGHVLILVEFRSPDRPPAAIYVRAEWVLTLISPGLLTQFLDREDACVQPGRHCQFYLNNRPCSGFDSIPFAHGDFVLIEIVETDAQGLIVYKPQPESDTFPRRFGDFGLIMCLDVMAFILTFSLLAYFQKPRTHRLCKVGLTRYTVHGRRPRTKSCWKTACFLYLLTSAEAIPLLQRAARSPDHDLDHPDPTDFGFLNSGLIGCRNDDGPPINQVLILVSTPDFASHAHPDPTDFGLPSSGLIGCRHDGEAPTNSELRPVSIPEFAFQAQQLRQPRMTFEGGFDLQNAVARLSEIAPGPFVLETYGLYEESVGTRMITVHTLTLQHIRSTVHAAWIDYTSRFDSRILYVQPQPTYVPPPVKLFLIVQFIDFGLHLPPTFQPVLVEQQVVSASGATDTTVRVAEYVDTPTNIETVFIAARLTHSCLPRGIRPCAVHWRNREWTYPSILRPLAGDYIVVRADNLEQYFRGTAGFFPGARRFALDGQRVFAQLHSGNMLPLWIHAIGHNYEPLGWRQTMLPKQDLLQPERVWNYAQHLWRDKTPGRAARLIPANPQPSVRNQGRIRLHLIFAFRVRMNYQPTLYVGMLHFDAAYHSYAQELQWNAVYTPATCDTDGLLRASTFWSFADIVRSENEIVYGGATLDGIAELAVLPGAFFVVNLYVTTWLNVVINLWQHVQQLPQPPTQRPTSLLQTKVHLRKATLPCVSTEQFFLHPYFNLPPPGNGTLIDLRRNLDTMDDITFHDWGECCFDVNAADAAPITAVHVHLPNLRNFSDYLCGACLPSMPSSYIYDHASDLPPACLSWVDLLSAQPPEQPVCRQVYTDGSYDAHSEPPVRVGWGFVVFLCGIDCIYLEHLACGYIEDDLCPMAHGLPVQLNARTGEIEALIQASLWLLSAGSV